MIRPYATLKRNWRKKYDDIFEGPDTDKLNKAFQRGDGVHFSEKGQETHAAGWLKAIKKNCF